MNHQRTYPQTHRIRWSDAWHRIEVDGYVQDLSPTQYRILRPFAELLPATVTDTGEVALLAYRDRRILETQTELLSDQLVKNISKLNARLAAIGLRLSAFQKGYILTLSSCSSREERIV